MAFGKELYLLGILLGGREGKILMRLITGVVADLVGDIYWGGDIGLTAYMRLAGVIIIRLFDSALRGGVAAVRVGVNRLLCEPDVGRQPADLILGRQCLLLDFGAVEGDALIGLAELFGRGGRVVAVNECLVRVEVLDQGGDERLLVVAVGLRHRIAILAAEVDERPVPILGHVLGAGAADLVDEARPVPSLGLDEGEDGEVFLDGPLALADVGGEVVEPVLTTLLGSLVVLSLGAEEESARDIAPLAVN